MGKPLSDLSPGTGVRQDRMSRRQEQKHEKAGWCGLFIR